jgi:hypothetical protein
MASLLQRCIEVNAKTVAASLAVSACAWGIGFVSQRLCFPKQKEIDKLKARLQTKSKRINQIESDLEGRGKSSLLICLDERERVKLLESEAQEDCAVCLEKFQDKSALVPCGHCFCAECAQRLVNCPLCRTDIEQTCKIYS